MAILFAWMTFERDETWHIASSLWPSSDLLFPSFSHSSPSPQIGSRCEILLTN